jgi:hypothetical protein
MTDGKTLVASAQQLRWLLGIAALQPGGASPLKEVAANGVAPALAAGEIALLVEGGWLEESATPRLTKAAAAGLQALCQPRLAISLVMGMRDTISSMELYSARGLSEGSLVSYAAGRDGDAYRLLPGLSPSLLADMLTGQLLPSGLRQTLPFRATVTPPAMVALLGILDWRLRCVLQSTLDRDPLPDVRFSLRDMRDLIVEGRMATDLAWPVTLFSYLLPALDFGLDDQALQEAVHGLQSSGLVHAGDDGRYAISDPLLELCHALLPVVSFAALHVAAAAPEAPVKDGKTTGEATHLAFVRGQYAILMAQPVVDEQGQRLVNLDCLEEAELASILFELGLPGQTVVAAPAVPATPAPALAAAPVCPACGAAISTNDRFCGRCGATLQVAAPPPQAAPSACPRCQAPLKPGAKFCARCGALLS